VKHVNWSGDIIFENVSFVYASNNSSQPAYALRNLNLTIPGGSRVALIGGPGGGKSTILKLLLRLYDPTEGRVLVGGVDLRHVSTRDVRNAMALVEQDIFLFRMSVRDNIGFGCRGACDKEIVEAAKRAQADEFITTMPNGYDTIIGERGTTLSGGQRQRLAIARAIVQDPRILLLDDSVSAIDVETEYRLRKALDEVMRGRTSITVTQRLRTLLESDLILIVDKGRLVAAGTHRELLKKSEQYRRIFERLPGAMPSVRKRPRKGGDN
jgi:ATP-binding cassette subfamily B protein